MNRRLLILFTSESRGGAEEICLALGDGLRSHGWDVSLAFPFTPGMQSVMDECQAKQIECLNLGVRDGGTAAFLRTLPRIFKALHLLRKTRPDNVLINLSWPDKSIALIVACALLNIPAIVRFGGIPCVFPFPWLKRIIYRVCFSRRQKLVTISRNNRALAAQSFGIPPERISVIYNGVEINERYIQLDPDARLTLRRGVRERLGMDENAFIILTVGRLSAMKGYGDICAILPDLLAAHPGVHCLWVGDGELREELERRIAEMHARERVHLVGYQNNVPEWIAASDLFLFPTHSEGGQSLANTEAMAYGLPIVSSDASGIPEILEHGKNAVLFKKQDPQAMRSALEWALNHQEEMRALAGCAQLKARELTREAMVEQVNNLLRQVGIS